jgi:hypothetical protein
MTKYIAKATARTPRMLPMAIPAIAPGLREVGEGGIGAGVE